MNAFTVNMTSNAPQVAVSGKPLVGVREVQVVQRHGEFPQVMVLFDATDAQVDGLGLTELVRAQTTDASVFLAAIDAQALAAEVDAVGGYEANPIATALEVLREWANRASTA